jgi:hypothetical protein
MQQKYIVKPPRSMSGASNLQLQTSNLKPWLLSEAEAQTSNLKPPTSNLKPQTSNLKPPTSNFKP